VSAGRGAAAIAPRYLLAAWLLAAVSALVVFAALVPAYPGWATGVIGWIACALLWPRLTRSQSRVALLLVGFGVIGIAAGIASGKAGLIERALAQNIPLIGMLIAVSFLRLISVGPGTAGEASATGRYALLRTLFGVHIFGAVINFSAVAIFADRLTARTKLTLDQAVGLTQAFMIGALWSPFFGAMAVALTAAPGASLSRLIAVGAPLAVAGMLLTWATLSSKRHGYALDFVGYPIRFESLWVPAVLAIGVLAVHEARPDWSVLAVITALAPMVTAVTLLAREGNRAVASMRRLVEVRLPEMGGEVSLFLGAGVLSAGMAGAIAALDLGLPFARFGAFEASVVLVAINLLAWLGLHPVIMVSVAGPWLAPIGPDPTLLAMTFLMTWGIGLPACPMANTLLAMQGRYQIDYRAVLARNRVFSFWLTLAAIAVLYAYSHIALAAAPLQ
jgi:hypothetical protein